MSISENKRVLGLSALFILAFGGTMYYGYSRSGDFDAAQNRLTEIEEGFAGFEGSECAPTNANRKIMRQASDQVSRVGKNLQADMEKYANVCYGDGKVISPVDFQNEVRDAIARVASLASEKGAKVANSAADLGMAQYKNAVATAADVPYRSFQLKAVTQVVNAILGSGAPLLDKVYCAPLPTELIEARRPVAAFPLGFEVAFEVKRGQLPAILNSIYNNKEYFLTVTGLAVLNRNSLPGIDTYTPEGESAPAPTTGDELGEAPVEEAAAAPAEVRRIAIRKTGDPNETVRVHLNMQVRYFNPAKGRQ